MNDITKELSALVKIQRHDRKVTKIKRSSLLKKHNIEAKENLE